MQEPCRGDETARIHFRSQPAPKPPRPAPAPNPQQEYLRRAAAIQQAMARDLGVLKRQAQQAEQALHAQTLATLDLRKEINVLESRLLQQFVQPNVDALQEVDQRLVQGEDQRSAYLAVIQTLDTRIGAVDAMGRQVHVECMDRHARYERRIAELEKRLAP
jgi:hypothetical protein